MIFQFTELSSKLSTEIDDEQSHSLHLRQLETRRLSVDDIDCFSSKVIF